MLVRFTAFTAQDLGRSFVSNPAFEETCRCHSIVASGHTDPFLGTLWFIELPRIQQRPGAAVIAGARCGGAAFQDTTTRASAISLRQLKRSVDAQPQAKAKEHSLRPHHAVVPYLSAYLLLTNQPYAHRHVAPRETAH